MNIRFWIALLGLLVGEPTIVAAQESTYDVGVARVDITPDYPIRLNGFGGRRAESEGVTQQIWAKALAIRHGTEKPVLILTVDSLGIREPMLNEVARRLEEKAGIARDRIALTFTHSHTTPKVNGASDTIFSTPIPSEHQTHIDRYTQELTDALERVSLDAIADLQPGKLSWAVGKVDFAMNRRTPGGPVDHDLPALFVQSEDGKVRAVYVSYACHCVTLSHNKISGDWAGYAQELIERKFPDAVALVSIGCGSDSNPSSGVTGDRIDVATAQGAQIADEVERLSQAALRPISGPIIPQLKYLDLPLRDVPTEEQLRELAQEDSPQGYNARFQLQRLERGEAILTSIHYPVQTITFGDSLHMVFLAGEVCADYSLRLKKELNRDRLWMHGYSNDFCAYIPSERLLREGGYGGGGEIVYFALPAPFQPGLEEKIVDTVKEMTPTAFRVPEGTQGVAPRSPTDALRSFQLDPRLQIELVASEPLVGDPVAIEFGPDGRLWVVEMPDYSRETEETFEHHGHVKFLEDTDGDGRYDKDTVFLDGLRFPTGVTVWRKGVLVCDAPSILYAEDQDGDGRADVRKELYTGFATHNPHARVNSLRYGLDGWVYGSGALFGGEITSFTGEKIKLQRTDFRIQPDLGTIEPATGVTQQGRARDDWGNWFGCDNGTLAFHYPVYDQYVRRNAAVAPPTPQVVVAANAEAARLIPAGDLVLFALSGAPGRATSACGLDVYRDELLGRDFSGNLFTCEPVHQVVHRLVLERDRALFRGHRGTGEEEREFLASTDRWFRPVQVRTGPDGALWIVDMYRYVIEHKRWIPPETLAELDVFAGQTRGRIYRIYPQDQPPRKVPNLEQMNNAELVAALDSPNGVVRDMAQQQLLWREASDVAQQLMQLVRGGKWPQGRLHALCTLALRKQLPNDVLIAALHDRDSGVCRHAMRLSEERMDAHQPLLSAMVRRAKEGNYEMQLQAAYSLGFSHSPAAAEALAELAVRHLDDEYLLGAIKSSLHQQNIRPILAKLAANTGENREQLGSFLAIAVHLGDDGSLSAALEAITGNGPVAELWRIESLRAVLEARRRSHPDTVVDDQRVTAWLTLAETIAADTEVDETLRVAAIRLLALGDPELAVQQLSNLAIPQETAAVQMAAIESLGRIDNDEAATALVAAWDAATPSVRRNILDALLARPAWATFLLDAIEQQRIASNNLDAGRRQALIGHGDESIRARAEQLLAGETSTRQQIVEQFTAALKPGDRSRGAEVFQKHCATCHKLGDVGHAVGPDLAALVNKSPSSLLVSLLDPNRNVEDRYQSYIAVRSDGRTATGLMVNETSSSVTLMEQEGKTHVLLRQDLEALRGTGKSLMPEGFEKDISVEQTSDLVAFLMDLGPPRKHIDGNSPALVGADDDGAMTLVAATAEIYGGEITFEPTFQNIGLWHDEYDHVLWRVMVNRAGDYAVHLEWACHPGSAGNTYRLDVNGQTARGQVASTGGWDQYERAQVATVRLDEGQQLISIRPDGPLTRGTALLDLRAVVLRPIE